MTGAFVRAAALASALGPDLGSAVERLFGAPVAAARNTKPGGAWPYFAIPISGGDWRMRTEAIARSVAEDLRRVAAIAPARWAELPCIVGSSSFSVGAWDDGGWEALEPSFEFASRLARDFGVHGPEANSNEGSSAAHPPSSPRSSLPRGSQEISACTAP